jgi:Tol biopolymer transport system component
LAAFTVAQNGTLIYNTGVGAALSQLTREDRAGKELGRIGDPAIMDNPTLSPDGTRVAVDISDQKANNVDIWIENTTGAGNSRFTFDPAEEAVGVWSQDASMVAYRTDADGASLYLKPATGLERERKRFTIPPSSMDDIIPNSWSLDDKLSPAERSRIAHKAGLARSHKLSAKQRKRIAALGGKASRGKPKTRLEK